MDISHAPHEWDELVPSDEILKRTHMIFLLLGAFICIFGLFSLLIKDRLYMSEALVASLFGIIIGPICLNIFSPATLFQESLPIVSLELSRIVIAVQCLVAGISLPGSHAYQQLPSISMLVGPVMLLMWLSSSLIIYFIAGIPFFHALVIAACVTPTDPVLANSIVKGAFADKHIPIHIRRILSAESAINDGFGLPLLFLPVYLARKSVGEAIGFWTLNVIVYQIILSTIIGIIIGFAARKLLKLAENRNWIDKESILGFFLALVLFTTGVLSVLGIDDVFGCFIVGTVLSWDQWFNKQIEESHIQEVIDALINMSFFIYFGSLIPWSQFNTLDPLSLWKLFLIAALILLFRRLPFIMLLYRWIPVIQSPKEAFFCGWFGPIGVGAIFYAMIAQVYLHIPPDVMFPMVCFIVLSSVVIHGGTVSLFEFGLTRHESWQTTRKAAKAARIDSATAAAIAANGGISVIINPSDMPVPPQPSSNASSDQLYDSSPDEHIKESLDPSSVHMAEIEMDRTATWPSVTTANDNATPSITCNRDSSFNQPTLVAPRGTEAPPPSAQPDVIVVSPTNTSTVSP